MARVPTIRPPETGTSTLDPVWGGCSSCRSSCSGSRCHRPSGPHTAAADSGLVSDPSAEGLGPLPAGDPVPMSLAEFQTRALHDPNRSLEGRRVRLVGFASPGPGPEWVLTRMSLNCCAADGFAVKVRVEGADAVPDDEWVEVLGTWRPAPVAAPGAEELPVVEVQWMDRISVPFNPYE